MKRWLTGRRGTRMDWWKKTAQVHTCTILIVITHLQYCPPHCSKEAAICHSLSSHGFSVLLTLNILLLCTKLYLLVLSIVFLVSDVVSGSASQSSSANDISSMSTEQTLASDTDSSSIDTLTGPLDESQWTQSMATCVCLSACLSSHLQYPNITFPFSSLLPYPPIFWILLFYLFFLRCISLLYSSTSMNRSIFLFSFRLWWCGNFRLCFWTAA